MGGVGRNLAKKVLKGGREMSLEAVRHKFNCGFFNVYTVCICLAILVLAAILLGLGIVGIGIFAFLVLLAILLFIFF